MIEGILVQGLVFALMALGVFITFRVLDFPDLTVDGSFPMGAAIMAQFAIADFNNWAGLLIAFLAGVLAGVVTALIHNKLKVPHLLAGIITMTMLYSVNLRILGNRANLSILRKNTILTDLNSAFQNFLPKDLSLLLFMTFVVLIVVILLIVFFHTDLGYSLGALGNNPQMVISQGVNPEILKIIGVGLSNGLVALAGAFAALYMGFADVGLGQGIIIMGLTSVMIGEFVLRSRKIVFMTISAVIGSVIYQGIMYYGRYYGYVIHLTPNDLKLINGLLIIGLLAFTKFKSPFKKTGRKPV